MNRRPSDWFAHPVCSGARAVELEVLLDHPLRREAGGGRGPAGASVEARGSAERFGQSVLVVAHELDRAELSVPAAYPTSCSPQAWAAATPLLFLRLLLRLDPWLAQDRLHLAPALPPWLHRLVVKGIPLGDAHVDVAVDDGEVVTGGLGSHLVSPVPRQPISDLIAAGS